MHTYTQADSIVFGDDHVFQWQPQARGHILRVYYINTPILPAEKDPDDVAPRWSALLVMSGPQRIPRHELIPAPEHPGQLYTPQRWVELGLIAAWWPSVRPLLSALSWVSPLYHGLDYRTEDSRDITVFTRRMEGVEV